MKRSVPFVSLVIVLLACGAVFSRPDLVVTSLSLEPVNPVAGESVILEATVRNVGTSGVEEAFQVRFALDGAVLGSPTLPSLDAGRSQSVTVRWQAEPGAHTISVEADQPSDRIDEGNETNNALVATVVVPVGQGSASYLSELKVAVARFEDRSGSGFINVGEGVADELIQRLVTSGVRVLERSEFEAVMQERGLNPSLTENLATAGQILGADLLIVGSVTKAAVQQSSLSLGFASFTSVTARVEVTARLVNVYTSQILKAVSAEGEAEGAGPARFDFGQLFQFLQPVPTAVCAGGLLTDKSLYSPGEAVRIGYRNPGLATWYSVEIDTGGGAFVRVLNLQFVPSGGCGEWLWDGRDTFGAQMGPGTYTAKLWDGTTYVAATSFQIKPGISPVIPFPQVTVGSAEFATSVAGEATSQALNQLVVRLIQGMEEVAPAVLAARESLREEGRAAPQQSEGEVADVLPDGRVAINIGAANGVSLRDFFQVLATANVIRDPTTGEILTYDVLGVKGEIVIVEVRDRASYGVRTTIFDALVGDIVRRLNP